MELQCAEKAMIKNWKRIITKFSAAIIIFLSFVGLHKNIIEKEVALFIIIIGIFIINWIREKEKPNEELDKLKERHSKAIKNYEEIEKEK